MHYQTYINSLFASAEAFTRINYEGHRVQLELNVQQFGTDVSLAKIALLIVESQRARQPWVLAVMQRQGAGQTSSPPNVKDKVHHGEADGKGRSPKPTLLIRI